MTRRRGLLVAFGAAALAAAAAFFSFGGKKKKPPAGPHALPDDAPAAHAVAEVQAQHDAFRTISQTSQPATGLRYAGKTWTQASRFVGWVEPRYGPKMEAAEAVELARLGYTNEDDWFTVQSDDPTKAATITTSIVRLRRQALARAIAADAETPRNLLSLMRWAQMAPGGPNEDAEMWDFANSLSLRVA